jgi:hypothetical protein|eukprot:5426803-Prymnesium_polylepis.2
MTAFSLRRFERKYPKLVLPTMNTWYERVKHYSGMAFFTRVLWEEGGFTLAHRRDNQRASDCTDLLLVRDRPFD